MGHDEKKLGLIAPFQRLWTWATVSRTRFGLLCAAAVLGFLFWARLIVVSDLPRMAIAGDEAVESIHSTDN